MTKLVICNLRKLAKQRMDDIISHNIQLIWWCKLRGLAYF